VYILFILYILDIYINFKFRNVHKRFLLTFARKIFQVSVPTLIYLHANISLMNVSHL
jgi:hypothetical protein